MYGRGRRFTFRKEALGAVLLTCCLLVLGCSPRIVQRQFTEDEVGLAALREQNVRQVVHGDLVQGYVSRYPLFAETINTEVMSDLGGYVERYNVYARETLTFPRTGLEEVDPFLFRASKSVATVRMATRMMNYIGVRLRYLEDPRRASKDVREVYYSMTPEELSLAVGRVRDSKGMLSREQKRELAKDILALVAIGAEAASAAEQTKGLLTEGENLKVMLASSAFRSGLERNAPGRAKLLPEIESHLNGILAGLRAASGDGVSIARNARAWSLHLADAMQ